MKRKKMLGTAVLIISGLGLGMLARQKEIDRERAKQAYLKEERDEYRNTLRGIIYTWHQVITDYNDELREENVEES